MALALLLRARLAVRPDPELLDRTDPGAGVALAPRRRPRPALPLWLLNPYAALLAVPAAHCGCWPRSPGPRAAAARPRAAAGARRCCPRCSSGVYYLFALSLDPLGRVWYLLLLVTGHSVGLATALIGCLWLGLLGAVIELPRRAPREQRPPPEPAGPRVYGPGSYAGPGSLGGPASRWRR